jgi:hypothetical protein
MTSSCKRRQFQVTKKSLVMSPIQVINESNTHCYSFILISNTSEIISKKFCFHTFIMLFLSKSITVVIGLSKFYFKVSQISLYQAFSFLLEFLINYCHLFEELISKFYVTNAFFCPFFLSIRLSYKCF